MCPLGVLWAHSGTARGPRIPQLPHQRPPNRTYPGTQAYAEGMLQLGWFLACCGCFFGFRWPLGVPQVYQTPPGCPQYHNCYTNGHPPDTHPVRRPTPSPFHGWGVLGMLWSCFCALHAPWEYPRHTRTPGGCPGHPNCHTNGQPPDTYPARRHVGLCHPHAAVGVVFGVL